MRKITTSSNIDEIGKDGDDLTVTFKGGRKYRYRGVSDDVLEALIEADDAEDGSVGKVLREHVINAGYEYEKIGDE